MGKVKDDLTGQRFGKLTVINKVEGYIATNGSKPTMLHCECDCGKEKDILKDSLTSNKTKSCGCLKKEKGDIDRKSLIGMKFGRLTVLYQTDYYFLPSGKRVAQWYCQCDCNLDNPNFATASSGSLQSGNTASCGCFAKEQIYKAHKKYNSYNLNGDCGIGHTFKDEPFLFDLEDFNKIKEYCWCYDKDGYVITNSNNKTIWMHRLIMSPKENEDVDHIYHVHHDNRKNELRSITRSQNQMNKVLSIHNTTGIKGVRFTGNHKPWKASITIDGKCVQKAFKNREDAIVHRIYLEEKYHGEYALKEKEQLNNNLQEVTI